MRENQIQIEARLHNSNKRKCKQSPHSKRLIFEEKMWQENCIPVIDVQELLDDPEIKSEAALSKAKEITDAMEDFGFVTITNFQIEGRLINGLTKLMTEFMQVPLEERKKFCVNNDDHGYFPASKDGKEGFDVRIRGVNWPDENGSLSGIVKIDKKRQLLILCF